MLRIADSVAKRIGLLDRPLNAETLMAAAMRNTGLRDFGDLRFRHQLRLLLVACAQEAHLSLIGRLALRWDVIRLLSNVLRLHDEEARAPGILEQRIEQPIFITGMPRSGTSFLHRLVMEDPANRVPRVWQTIFPYPGPRHIRSGRDRRQEIVGRQLRQFERLAPDFRRMHPLAADSPQECSEITAHAFASMRFDTTYHVPSYREWLDQTGHLEAYYFHKRFLQHLQHLGGRGRWLLKCPDHVFALDAIRTVYPDARLVFVHRDPLKVLPSNAKLTEILRQPFTRSIDRIRLGQHESDYWLGGTARMIEADQRQDFAEPIFHIRYTDLVADPPGSVAALYRHFGLPLGEPVIGSISRLVATQSNGGYGTNTYRFADHGFAREAEGEKFAAYTTWFGVKSEAREDRTG